MTNPISGRTPPGLSVSRPNMRMQTPSVTGGQVRGGVEGSLGRVERNLMRESFGVDRFDPSTNSRLPGGGALRQVPTLAQGQFERRGSVAAAGGRGQVEALGITRDVEARALVAAGEVTARYSVSGRDGVQAQAGVQASALLGELRVRTPGPNGREVGSVTVGATAGATGTLNLNPASGDMRVGLATDNFIGARATGQVRLGSENASITPRATLQAGLGLTARLEGGLQNNRLTYRAELGAALGVGANFGVSVDVNLQAARETAGRIAAGAAEGLSQTALGRGAAAVGRGASAVGEFLRNRGIPLPG